MSAPGNYLLTAPAGEKNPFGTPMHSTELIRGLQRVDPRVCVPMPRDPKLWLKSVQHLGGDGSTDMTCIWIGDPKHGQKVAAFHLGQIPEWTQVAPDGRILRRGWRNILQRCEKAGIGSRRQLEAEFKVNLDVGPPDQSCQRCRADGKLTFNVHASGLCTPHENARLDAEHYQIWKVASVLEAASRAAFADKAPKSVYILPV